MVGGAPVTENYKNSIGADYYAPDAASASDIALQICTA
jgi:methanogenic corrinoid protein MtbC1